MSSREAGGSTISNSGSRRVTCRLRTLRDWVELHGIDLVQERQKIEALTLQAFAPLGSPQ